MKRNYYLNYWTMPSGRVVVYSSDEHFVVSGPKGDVTSVVRSMAQRLREQIPPALDETH